MISAAGHALLASGALAVAAAAQVAGGAPQRAAAAQPSSTQRYRAPAKAACSSRLLTDGSLACPAAAQCRTSTPTAQVGHCASRHHTSISTPLCAVPHERRQGAGVSMIDSVMPSPASPAAEYFIGVQGKPEVYVYNGGRLVRFPTAALVVESSG